MDSPVFRGQPCIEVERGADSVRLCVGFRGRPCPCNRVLLRVGDGCRSACGALLTMRQPQSWAR
eukprot:5743367-Alexandrium_andersonii.AAC.1